VLEGLLDAIEEVGLEGEALTVMAQLAPAEQIPFGERIVALASEPGCLALLEAAQQAGMDAFVEAFAAASRHGTTQAARS
jgi:hypothetical protein